MSNTRARKQVRQLPPRACHALWLAKFGDRHVGAEEFRDDKFYKAVFQRLRNLGLAGYGSDHFVTLYDIDPSQ